MATRRTLVVLKQYLKIDFLLCYLCRTDIFENLKSFTRQKDFRNQSHVVSQLPVNPSFSRSRPLTLTLKWSSGQAIILKQPKKCFFSFLQYQLATSQYQMVRSTFSSFPHSKKCRRLISATSRMNNSSEKIVRKILGNAENQTRGCWVRSANATSVLCRPPEEHRD